MTNFCFLLLFFVLLTGCGPQGQFQQTQIPPPIDPCAQMYFQEYACSTALNQGGFYHYGSFIPYRTGYDRTIVVYRNQYNGWVSQGNSTRTIDFNAPQYSRSYRQTQPPPNSAPVYVERYNNVPPPVPANSYRQPQPRDPQTGRFVKRDNPVFVSPQSPSSNSYRTTPLSNPNQNSSPVTNSGSYRSTAPTTSTSMSSQRTSVSANSISGSSRSTTSTNTSRIATSSPNTSGSSRGGGSTTTTSGSSRR